MHRNRISPIAIGLLIAASLAPVVRGATDMRDVADADILRAIDEAKRYLYGQQGPDGGWIMYNPTVPPGGYTAIATFALLEAGEDPSDPRIAKALEALVKIGRGNLYVVSFRVMALSMVAGGAKDSPYYAALMEDIEWLTLKAAAHGAWGYSGPQRTGDNSCSQIALLALWEADRAGVAINPKIIRAAEKTWLKRQRKDGGWVYPAQAPAQTPSTVSMAAAGLASLFICQDSLPQAGRRSPNSRAIDAAWDYLGENLTEEFYKNGYLAFCIQRVGMASGRKGIGKMDWFAVAAEKLAEPDPKGRTYRGEWGSHVRASFELIFLARGRLPLVINKLQHGRPGQWDYHLRDVPRFTEYLRRQFEQRMRWQVVKISDPVEAMLDAPVLMVSGTGDPQFTDDQWAKLREYTLRGGTLLVLPIAGNAAFLEGVKKKLEALYAPQRTLAGGQYALEQLPETHALYNIYAKLSNGPRFAPIWGVSDGTRLLAVVCKRDIAKSWNRGNAKNAMVRKDFSLGVNLIRYATGSNRLPRQLRPVFAGTRRTPRHRAKVAWARHDGGWYTQPWALESLSQKLTAENRVAIDVTVGTPLEEDKLKGHDLLWITGISAMNLSEAEIRAIGKYVDAGGTVFLNAVGGASRFNRSANSLLQKLFSGQQVVHGYASEDSPLMTGRCGQFRGPRLGKPKRTAVWRRLGPSTSPRISIYQKDGRIVAIHVPHGVHDTLDGHTAYGAISYMPESARDIAANILLYSLAEMP